MTTRRARWRWHRFRRDTEGVAVVEFALLLPVMLLTYLGVVDIVQLVTANRKVTQLTLALADLTARAITVPPAEIQNIFNASQSIMMPFDTANVTMVISSVVIDASGVAKVCWSNASKNGTALKRGTTVTLPDSVRVASTSVIMATASYAYKPMTSYALQLSSYTLGDNPIYTRPRAAQPAGTANIEQVVRTDVAGCPTF